MADLRSFGFVARPDARVLILGSMPGQASLNAQEYYAHKQNAFWRIMGVLVGATPELPYVQRLEKLTVAGIALWDVIAACEREGSLDANIVGKSIRPNDFARFLAEHPGIRRICFNGGTAAESFRRHVQPGLDVARYELIRLPSTSPAHATFSFAQKLAAWSAGIGAPN